jgi:hypothetical protein
MKRAPLGLLALLATPVPGPAVAPSVPETMYMNGEALVRTCGDAEKAVAGGEAYDFANVIECTSYLSGALDQQTQMRAIYGAAPTICVPPGVTKGQVAVVFVSYARQHTEQQKYIATDLVTAAMSSAYPCPKGPPASVFAPGAGLPK